MRRALVLLVLVLVLVVPASASADYQRAVGQFATGTGAVSSTVSITGLAFQPKWGIFFWNGSTSATDAASSATYQTGVAFASTASCVNAAVYSRHNVATSVAGLTARTDSCIDILSADNNWDGRLTFTSWNSDGATFTVADQFTQSYRVGYILGGGSDPTNSAVGTFLTGVATGDKDITGVGFQPDTVLTISLGDKADTANGITTAATLILGAWAGSNTWVAGLSSGDGLTTPDTKRYGRAGDIVAAMDSGGTFRARGSGVSFLSDGFRINLGTASATRQVLWLAIKGGRYWVTNGLTQTDTSTDTVLSGFGFTPIGLLVASHAGAASAAGTASQHAELSIGTAGAIDSGVAMSVQDEDKASVSNTNVGIALDADKVYVNVSTTGTAEGIMNLRTIDADGATFRMADADPSQSFFGVWAFGTSASACEGARLMLTGVGCP